MGKQKIFVREVIPGERGVDVAIVDMDGREMQVCIPKYCNIAKCVGEEIFYESKHGKVYLSKVRTAKHSEEDAKAPESVFDTGG